MIDITGRELKEFLLGRGAHELKKRYIFNDIMNYLNDDNHKVMCLYGLRRTGKTILMAQSIMELDKYDDSLYVLCEENDTVGELKKHINNHKCKYIFIDEATKLTNFINTCSILADIYTFSGKKVVMAGTDSLGFRIASKDELFDRVILKHTTYIPYNEYNHLLGLSIDKYIQYGGTLSLEGVDYNNYRAESSPFYEYLDGAIVENITHSLKNWDYGRKYGYLQKLHDDGDLESAIRKVVERENRDFLASTINNNFTGEIRGSLIDLVNKHSDLDVEPLHRDELRQRTRAMLHIREPLFNKVNDDAINQIIAYLIAMDVMIKGPKDGEYIFTQPGLRYYHAKVLSDALDADEYFQKYSETDKSTIKEKLEESVKGNLLEDIVYTQLKMKYRSADKSEYSISKYSNNMGSEFDVVVSDFKRGRSLALEVKHSSEIDDKQVIHLKDKEFCKEFEEKYGTQIVEKAVIYNGQTKNVSGIQYMNAEEFLTNTDEILGQMFLKKNQTMNHAQLIDVNKSKLI